MKNKGFLPLMAALAFSSAMVAQVRVQPVKDVHTVVIGDAVTLKVYIDSAKGTELEVNSSAPVAMVAKGVMRMDGATKAVLRLSPSAPITHFTVEDAASLEFVGPMDFNDNQFTISAEDAGRVKVTKNYAEDTLKAGYVLLHASDNGRIVSEIPLLLTAYDFKAEDHGYVSLPSADMKPDIAMTDLNNKITVQDNGKVVIKARGEDSVLSRHIEYRESNRSEAARDLELNYFWGFNNWGSHPFGHASGDAELNYYFMNNGFSIDMPVINRRKFGMYVGLGLDGNLYHFDSPLVNFTGTEFAATTTPNITVTGGTLDPDNWNTYFNTLAITVPVTFSFEPWKYDGVCIRLSAITGINIVGILSQQYKTKAVELVSNDRLMRKQMKPFALDARLSVQYSNFGFYVQTAALSLFKKGIEPLYPLKFGIYWTMSGR